MACSIPEKLLARFAIDLVEDKLLEVTSVLALIGHCGFYSEKECLLLNA